MKIMKKHIAIALTAALLAFPLSSAIVEACIPDAPVMVATSTPTQTPTPIPTPTQTPTPTPTPTPQAEVVDATAVAKAEAAVLAYEAAPITTLAEVATAEGLKAAAHDAVGALVDCDAKAAFVARVKIKFEAIKTAKTELQAQAAVAKAEAAVLAYEAAPITTLAEIATAEGLKAAADKAVAAVANTEVKTALKLKVTTRAAAITAAKTALNPPVVVTDGKLAIPSTQYSDFIDKLQLALAFDPAHKAELNKRHANRKLAQAQQFMKDGNVEACKIAFNEYKDKIAEAQAFLLAAEDPNSAIAKALAIALADVDSKNIQVLTNLTVKLPPQAAQKLALNVVRVMDKAVVKIQKEEAKADPAVTPVVPTDTEKKDLEKQTKAAVTDFKTAVNAKDNEDKSITYNQRTKEKIQSEVNQKLKNLSQKSTVRTSDNNKDGRNHQGDRDTNQRGDNNRGDHR